MVFGLKIFFWRLGRPNKAYMRMGSGLEAPILFFFLFFLSRGKGYLFIYLFLAVLGLRFVRGLSLVAASGGHSSSRCAGLSLSRPLLLRSTGSRRAGSVVVAHGPSYSAACGIFPDQGSNPYPLHWQADSQPLRHQGSPKLQFLLWTKWSIPAAFWPMQHVQTYAAISNICCFKNTLKIKNIHNHNYNVIISVA